LLIGNK